MLNLIIYFHKVKSHFTQATWVVTVLLSSSLWTLIFRYVSCSSVTSLCLLYSRILICLNISIISTWIMFLTVLRFVWFQVAEDSLQTLQLPVPDPMTPTRVFLEATFKEGFFPMMPHSMYSLPLWPGITLVLLTKVMLHLCFCLTDIFLTYETYGT